jgi:membrane-bound lytic murein transglycosylase C
MRLLSKALLTALLTSTLSTQLLAQNNAQDDAFAELEKMLDQQFADTDTAIDDQFERIHRAIARAYEGLTKKIEVDWQEDIKVPSATSWVTYDKDMQSRVEVNFDKGIYVAEVLVQNNNVENSIAQLSNLMQTLQTAKDEELNQRDSFLNELDQELRNENIIQDAQVDNTIDDEKPALLEQVVALPSSEELEQTMLAQTAAIIEQPDIIEAPVETNTEPEEVLAVLVEKPDVTPPEEASKVEPKISVEKASNGNVKKIKVEIKFVNNYQEKILSRYLDDIKRISGDFGIEVSTMLAIMETESSFNPRATSPIPAFGLMQVVPSTAGIDAYRHVYGEKKVVSAEFLYDELNNILMGTAYFNLLKNRYLKRITNGQSRFYCAVASYNTGVGNLARTFIGKKDIKKAAKHINTLEPQQVFDFLLENLPADETKNYLRKIVKRAEKYKIFDEGMI